MIAQAVEAEFEAFLGSTAELVLPDGAADGWFATGMIRFARSRQESVRSKCKSRRPAIAPLRASALPLHVEHPAQNGRAAPRASTPFYSVLYLRGISAGDFQEALAALLGKDAPNLSAAVRSRASRANGRTNIGDGRSADLSARYYVYVWADGVFLQARMEPQAECMLVLMGATPEGKKELIGFQTWHVRESGQSWKERFAGFEGARPVGRAASRHWRWRARVLEGPRRGVPDDASSAMLAAQDIERALDKLPKSMQPNVHKDLREIWLSPNRGAAEAAMAATFAEKYAPKYDKAVECLIKDRRRRC